MWQDPALWYEWIKVSAFIAGLIVGTAAVVSPSWVWLRKQVLTPVAGWLATLGTVMLSMSIWQSVQIEGPGFKVDIGAIHAQLDRIEATMLLASRASSGSGYAAQEAARGVEPDRTAVELAQIRELDPGFERTKLIAKVVLDACQQAIEAMGWTVDAYAGRPYEGLNSAATEEQVLSVMQDCVNKLGGYSKRQRKLQQ